MEKLLIAEYKPFSPYVGRISNETIEQFMDRMSRFNPWMISIIVDERWAGSYQLLGRALAVSYWPVMAKGKDVNAPLAVKAGAEWALSYDYHEAQIDGDFLLFEVKEDDDQDTIANGLGLKRVLINNRNMQTGNIDMDFAKKCCEHIEHDDAFVIVGSGYKNIEDPNIPERANAVLIGTEFQNVEPRPRAVRRGGRIRPANREEREAEDLNAIFEVPHPDEGRPEEEPPDMMR